MFAMSNWQSFRYLRDGSMFCLLKTSVLRLLYNLKSIRIQSININATWLERKQ